MLPPEILRIDVIGNSREAIATFAHETYELGWSFKSIATAAALMKQGVMTVSRSLVTGRLLLHFVVTNNEGEWIGQRWFRVESMGSRCIWRQGE